MTSYVIIEDERPAFNQLQQLLAKNYAQKLSFAGTADTISGATQLIQDTKPNLVFLDIQLKDGLSFDILDQFNNQHYFEVIFTSGLIDYKEKAMDYFAFYFINKPVEKERLKTVVDTYLAKKSAFDYEKYAVFKNQITSQRETIALPQSNGSFSIVHLDHILYCEADGSYTNYFTVDGKKFTSSNNLKKVENLLENTSFYRIHRSTLVNLKQLKDYNTNGKITLKNNKTLVVSERNKRGFFSFLKLHNYTLD